MLIESKGLDSLLVRSEIICRYLRQFYYLCDYLDVEIGVKSEICNVKKRVYNLSWCYRLKMLYFVNVCFFLAEFHNWVP